MKSGLLIGIQVLRKEYAMLLKALGRTDEAAQMFDRAATIRKIQLEGGASPLGEVRLP